MAWFSMFTQSKVTQVRVNKLVAWTHKCWYRAIHVSYFLTILSIDLVEIYIRCPDVSSIHSRVTITYSIL